MLTSLSGCGRAGFEGPICPSLTAYDQATQNTAADEVESGKAPTLNQMHKDYLHLRDQIKAVCK